LKRLRDFPKDARHDVGYQLDQLQRGKQPADFKPMPSIGRGVEEIRVWDDSGTYRVIYTARLADAVYVVHAFQKKIADTGEEAANLRVRSDLMSKLAAIIERNGWNQTEAASRCGVTQPRINDLLRGRLSRFSVDALVNIAAALGQRVHVELDTPAPAARSRQRPPLSMQPRRQRSEGRLRRKVASRVAARAGAKKKRRTHTA
jgi:phage-related protein